MKKIAVCLQLYHTDLWKEFEKLLIPYSDYIKLYVALCKDSNFEEISHASLRDSFLKFDHHVSYHKNYGADIAPFLYQLQLLEEEFFIKIHSKKSRFGKKNQANWRPILLNDFFASKELFLSNIESISNLKCGMVCSELFLLRNTEDSNAEKIKSLCNMLEMNYEDAKNSKFAAGTMFLSKSKIFQDKLNLNFFEIDGLLQGEPGNVSNITTGSYSHSLERIFGYIIKQENLEFCFPKHKTIKIINNQAPNKEYFNLVRLYNNECYVVENPELFGKYSVNENNQVVIEWKNTSNSISNVYNRLDKNTTIIKAQNYETLLNSKINASSDNYVLRDKDSLSTKPQVKIIAHYFPQYHVIPENEKWWGQEFTDWQNVKRAKPLFENQYQPHIPDDYLGYYDLTDTDVQKKQIELAKQYGIYGFCFYTYWFNGKRLLEKPLDNYLENKELDLPFCICWANENWTRTWDGLDQEVLISQEYTPEDDIKFIEHMSKYLKDSRYIKVDNKPLIMVYRPSLFPNPKETTERWRNWCRQNEIGEIYLVYCQSFTNKDPKEFGFDAASEFPPNDGTIEENLEIINRQKEKVQYEPSRSSWDHFLISSINYKKKDYTLFRCIMPSWDNTARKGNRGHSITKIEPAKFQHMVENAFDFTLENHKEEERIVFVNSWNEWAEGCHLEPDKKYGYAWLKAIKNTHKLFEPKQELIKNIKQNISKNNTNIHPNEIAIVYHAFYPELLEEAIYYANKVEELNYCYFIVTTTSNKINQCKQIASQISNNFKFLFIETENKGRDTLPLFKIYDLLLNLNIKIFCKLHSKKSLSEVVGDSWRKDLINSLLNPENVKKTLIELMGDKTGITVPEQYAYSVLDKTVNNSLNSNRVKLMAKILNSEINEHSVFPAGSMFWAKTESLLPMYKILDASNDTFFPIENNQVDNTFAHICERLFCVSAQSVGLKVMATTDRI